MINNRQSGRRRGRGGQRPQGGPGRSDGGNRIDNRARGNAAQLLEKYKALARDAQMGGDRVMTEYYHQFADHYFRVLSESRARFEENRPKRDDDDEEYDDDRGAEMRGDDAFDDEPREPYRQQQPRADREQPRGDRDQQMRGDRDRQPRGDRDQQARPDRQPRPERQQREAYQDRGPSQPYPRDDAHDESARDEQPRDVTSERPREFERRPRRPLQRDPAPLVNGNGTAHGRDDGDEVGFNAELLPPSFSASVSEPGTAEEAPAARRRGRPRKVIDEQPPVE